jgi:DNA-binding CsgD family transcriptional regulator
MLGTWLRTTRFATVPPADRISGPADGLFLAADGSGLSTLRTVPIARRLSSPRRRHSSQAGRLAPPKGHLTWRSAAAHGCQSHVPFGDHSIVEGLMARQPAARSKDQEESAEPDPPEANGSHHGLLARKRIMLCLLHGLSNEDIGRRLKLSEGAIGSYVDTMRHKLRATLASQANSEAAQGAPRRPRRRSQAKTKKTMAKRRASPPA